MLKRSSRSTALERMERTSETDGVIPEDHPKWMRKNCGRFWNVSTVSSRRSEERCHRHRRHGGRGSPAKRRAGLPEITPHDLRHTARLAKLVHEYIGRQYRVVLLFGVDPTTCRPAVVRFDQRRP